MNGLNNLKIRLPLTRYSFKRDSLNNYIRNWLSDYKNRRKYIEKQSQIFEEHALAKGLINENEMSRLFDEKIIID